MQDYLHESIQQLDSLLSECVQHVMISYIMEEMYALYSSLLTYYTRYHEKSF